MSMLFWWESWHSFPYLWFNCNIQPFNSTRPFSFTLTPPKFVKDTKFSTYCSSDLHVDSDESYPPMFVSGKSENCLPTFPVFVMQQFGFCRWAATRSGSALACSVLKFSLLTNGFGASGKDYLGCQNPGFLNFRTLVWLQLWTFFLDLLQFACFCVKSRQR